MHGYEQRHVSLRKPFSEIFRRIGFDLGAGQLIADNQIGVIRSRHSLEHAIIVFADKGNSHTFLGGQNEIHIKNAAHRIQFCLFSSKGRSVPGHLLKIERLLVMGGVMRFHNKPAKVIFPPRNQQGGFW